MNNENREQQMMAAAEAYAAEIYKDEPDNFHTDEQLCETINDYCAGWRSADQHPHWIPVDEKLPEEGQEVFAWNGTFKESYKCIYHNGLFEDYLGALGKGAVTHWMPIVPPRKEDRE